MIQKKEEEKKQKISHLNRLVFLTKDKMCVVD
jgi:hypothetical protein